MATLPREQLEDWVERWLQVNRDAEKAGDWKPLADFYADVERGLGARRLTLDAEAGSRAEGQHEHPVAGTGPNGEQAHSSQGGRDRPQPARIDGKRQLHVFERDDRRRAERIGRERHLRGALGVALALDEGRVLFCRDDLAGAAQILRRDGVELAAKVVADDMSAC